MVLALKRGRTSFFARFADQMRGLLSGHRKMPIAYEYRCQHCNHEWILFSKRFTVGPTQWGALKYTCFSCQTFLSIATSVDANSWFVWYRNHESDIEGNSTTTAIASSIQSQLKVQTGLTPLQLRFDSIECPTCCDTMSTVPFGQHMMKCPKCANFTGEFDGGDSISIYASVDDDAEKDT